MRFSDYVLTAEGKDTLGSNIYVTASNLGNKLSRAEILGVLAANDVPDLMVSTRFFIRDSEDREFLVFYVSQTDKYYYEKLTVAV